MKPGITLALFASVILIGGAFWFRLHNPTPQVAIVAVKSEKLPDAYYQELLSNFLQATSTGVASPAAPPAENLTTTDLIGRQMMMDYLNLAGNGQATDANIQALADQYVQKIPTITQGVKVSYQDITTVSNNVATYKTYAEKLGAIYQKYAADINKTATGGNIGDTLTKAQSAFLQKVGVTYEARATELKNMSVPSGLASLHLQLININLTSAAAFEAAANTEADPATGLAGLITTNQSLDEETNILQEIANLLHENGV